MGGCGGKKQRQRQKEAATIGGQFNSIGSREEQEANRVLVLRLLGEIGADGYRMATSDQRLFIDDCKVKIAQGVNNAAFGWRQVAKMVEAHKYVQEKRKEMEDDKRFRTAHPRTSPADH